MRKFFLNFMTVLLATSLVMVSCEEKQNQNDPKDPIEDTQKPGDDTQKPGDNTQNPGEDETEPPEDFEGNIFNVAATSAAGESYPERAYMDVYLETEEQGIRISFNMSPGDSVLLEGEYVVDNEGSYPAGTYDPNYTYWTTAEAVEGEENFIVDGSIFVSVEGETYSISTKLMDFNGDSINYTYTGAIEWNIHRTPPYVNEELVYAEAQYGGDMAGSGNGWYWLYLTNLVPTETEFGTEEVVLYLFADGLGSATELPTGTFKFPTSQEEIFAAKTLVPGVYDEENGFLYSWVLMNDGQYYTNVYQLAAGTLEITKNADNTYTVEGNMADAGSYAGGATTTFAYTGNIEITDQSQSASGAPAVKSVNINKANKMQKMGRRAIRVRK